MLRNYLRVADLSVRDLGVLLDIAEEFERFPHARRDMFADEVVGLYFSKPSTRTRISFAVAIRRLGGIAEPLGPTDLQLGRGETIEDTARVISSYLQAFVIRTFDQGDVERFARAATIPVINALTDTHHPCQALADLLTLREHFGALAGLRVAYFGDGNNVSHSLMEAGALAGMHIVVATPEQYAPNEAIVREASAVADATGGSITVTTDHFAAAAGAHAVYTDVWLSMGDSVEERTARAEALAPFQVDAAAMARARSDAVFMHCLPAHRGEEVTADVIDGPQSVVFAQAERRLFTEQAVLAALHGARLEGRAESPLPSQPVVV